MTSSSRRKLRTIALSSALGALALACGSCGGPTAPTANVTGVWFWTQRTDTSYLFLEQQADTIVGWYCDLSTALTKEGAPISGRDRSFSWTLPWSPPGQTAIATVQNPDLIVVSYSALRSVREFRRATSEPARTGACKTTIAMPR